VATLLRRTAQMDKRWAQEARLLKDRYPGFRFTPRPPRLDLIALRATSTSVVEKTECDNPVRAWRGSIQPFVPDATHDEVRCLIADLAGDRDVGVRLNGTLAHLPGCSAPHDLPPELIPSRQLAEAYTIEMACRRPPGLPLVRSIAPMIWPEANVLVDDHPIVHEPFRPPHLQWREGALCVTFPPDRGWEWGDGVLADFLDQTALWLAKHTVWSETRERLGPGNGIWVGRATTHDEFAVLDRLDDLDPRHRCHCGSAKPYGECCRTGELAIARTLLLSMASDPWLAALRSGLGRFRPQYRDQIVRVLAAGAQERTPVCCWAFAASFTRRAV
jgi:hypothetical protein